MTGSRQDWGRFLDAPRETPRTASMFARPNRRQVAMISTLPNTATPLASGNPPDVLAILRRFDRGELTFDEAQDLLEARRKSRSTRFGRLLDALIG
jgi:hypothetical protein